MNSQPHYSGDQPGLEVGAPSVQHQYAGHYQEQSPYNQAASKEAIPYPAYAGLEAVPPPSSRLCGLPKRTFWIVLALVILVVGAALGGGLGGGLSAKHKTAHVPTSSGSTSGTPEQQTTSSSASPLAASTSTTASTTSSASVATSTIQPFSTSPGTYRIINVATNTAIDLLNGGTSNDTEVECWVWTPGASESSQPHQSWLLSSVSNNVFTIYNSASQSYITAPLGLDSPLVYGGPTYGAVPGNPSDPHAQFTILENSDNSISFQSVAYPTKVLDLDNSGSANGTPVLVWNIDSTTPASNQRWILVPYS
ncbi:carbohydrate-binding module family 13 protein [Stipitochalara longipes BDJ]|nr:carbohydrate-binding module family 13 protein [Stipitochalara longipes BDJ]